MRLPVPQPRSHGDDNLIPLINIVFLLLIFFMLAGALMRPDPLGVVPPESQAEQPAELRQVVLSVAYDGDLALDGERVDLDGLHVRLAELVAADPGLRLNLKADSRVRAEQLLPLLDHLRGAGLERISLITTAAPR